MSDQENAQTSAEFPVVVLGDADAPEHAPPKRVLQGRLAERWVLYPIYLIVGGSGVLVGHFCLTTNEWALTPSMTAWGMLFVWYWFYGVAYRYRRRVFKYFSVTVLVGLTWCLSLLSLDRAQAQVVATAKGLVDRPAVAGLYWASVLIIIAVSLLALHVLVLGRGYRGKKHG